MKKSDAGPGEPASEFISGKIAGLGDWRGETLGRMRKLIREADPGVVEEVKWMGTPVWSHSGIICTGEVYSKVVKFTFARGASIPDPSRLFNSSLEGNTRRAIDIREGERIDARAFKALVKAAVVRNGPPAKGGAKAVAGAIPRTAGVTFKSIMFRYPGKGGWHFAPVPKRLAPAPTEAWGRTPVEAVVDGIAWRTSVWRGKDGRTLLAIPARVRGAKGDGDRVTVTLRML